MQQLKCLLVLLVLAGCGKSDLTEAQKYWIDQVCACESEKCVSEKMGALAQAVHSQEHKITDEEAEVVSKKAFECAAKVRDKSKANVGNDTKEEAAPSAPPMPAPTEPQPSAEELAEKHKKEQLGKQVEALAKLSDPDEIMAAYKKEADDVCACDTDVDCMYGFMARIKGLDDAVKGPAKEALTPRGEELGNHMQRAFACFQKAQAVYMEEQQKVTDVGEQLIKLAKQYADSVCACGDLACANAIKYPETSHLEPKTMGDTMNERLVAESARSAECLNKLMHGEK